VYFKVTVTLKDSVGQPLGQRARYVSNSDDLTALLGESSSNDAFLMALIESISKEEFVQCTANVRRVESSNA
jgi:hypothetical protein